MARAAHIVKNVDESHPEAAARAAIEEVRARLEAGAEFAEVADTYSDCPGSGGDLGYFPRDQMVDEFSDVVFALRIGQVSRVFRTPFGFHIAKLLDRRPAGLQPFEDVRARLEDQLHRMKQQRALEDFIERLKARAEIREVKRAAQGPRQL